MGRRKFSISLIGIIFFMIFLSGCNGQSTANKVVDALDNREYNLASEIFEDALEDSNNDKELNDATSQAIQGYLDEVYNDVESGDRREESFSNLLNNIANIGVYDGALDRRVQDYKAMLDGTYLEEDNYKDDDYSSDDEYSEYEEVSGNPYSATDIDHDCTDFSTQEDAQLFYEANGGPDYDPHDLDRDNDGMACDWN